MAQIKYSALRSGGFTQAINKLMHYPRFTPKTGLAISRVATRMKTEADVAQAQFEALVKKYAFLDEKGEIAPGDKPGTFKIKPEHVEDFIKEQKELGDLTFTVDMPPIKISALEGVGLSPLELAEIECLLDLEEPAQKLDTPKLETAKLEAVKAAPQPEVNH